MTAKPLFVLCLACTLAAAASLRAADQETPISDLAKQLADKDEKLRIDAAEALAKKGTRVKAAIPALIEAYKKDDNVKVREYCIYALGKSGAETKVLLPVLQEALKDKKGTVAGLAIDALGALKDQAKPAVPDLIDMLKSRDHAARAADALGSIGPAAGPEALAALGAAMKKEATRAAACHALGMMGKAALPFLKEGLDEKKADARIDALLGLELLAEDGVADIAEVLKDKDPEVRLNALGALGRLGPKSKAAVKAMMYTLQDKEDDVREKTCETLGSVGPHAKGALPALGELADKDPKPEVRKAATLAVKRIKDEK